MRKTTNYQNQIKKKLHIFKKLHDKLHLFTLCGSFLIN